MRKTNLDRLFDDLKLFILDVEKKGIGNERKRAINLFAEKIVSKIREEATVKLNFICTHNSRRSQLSQVWAHTAAYIYDLPVQSFSGGVEVTAFNPRAMHALMRVGFQIESQESANPHHRILFSPEAKPIIGFSKIYDDEVNPKERFYAVMTCADADENCPFIPGAEERIPLRYKDPKISDDTPQEESIYWSE